VATVQRWLETDALAANGGVRRTGPVLEVLLDTAHERADAGELRDVLVPIAPLPTAHPWYWRRRPGLLAGRNSAVPNTSR
jgi:hypothetical protein